MLKIGAQLPTCGSIDEAHRAIRCRSCQRSYARRKRSRERVLLPPPVARCGATGHHERSTCRACRRVTNAAYYQANAIALKRRREAIPADVRAPETEARRARARVWAWIRRHGIAREACAECDRPSAGVAFLETKRDPLIAWTCRLHRGLLAYQLAEQAPNDRPTIAEIRAAAAEITVPAEVMAAIEAQAERHPLLPIKLDRRSPLFAARVAELTLAWRNRAQK